MNKIKLLIVEDDPDWVTAITFFLEKAEDMDIVAVASDKESAIRAVNEHKIDIILMDINLSGNKCDGILAAAEICPHHPVKIIMLTNLNDPKVIIDSFTAGAVNFVSKSDYKEIPSTIRSIYNRESSYEVLLKEYARLKEEEQLRSLTPAEREILSLTGAGYTQSQIQKLLFKSERTLKNQVNTVLKKLGVGSMREAIKKVKMKGLSDR